MLIVPQQEVHLPLLLEKKISLFIKREDLLHPLISGNKIRKLKYNLKAAAKEGATTLLTFGGAYSNHIAATAYAGMKHSFNTIGVIRGDELSEKWSENPTLQLAVKHGMKLHFETREAYRKKNDPKYIDNLRTRFGSFYLLPEGGSNDLAVRGCEEILTTEDKEFDIICAAVGTGATLSGIINSSSLNQHIIGFSALKGDFLKEDIRKFARNLNWELQTDYHFGGYAKVNRELIECMNDFKHLTNIPLDSIYTGKLIYGLLDMIKKDVFKPHTKILAIHTGGLQSNTAMNIKLKKLNHPLIAL